MLANAKANLKGNARDIGKVDKSGKPIIDVSKLVRFAEPNIDLDMTRNQYLGRTGFRGPAQSVSFTFGGANRNMHRQALRQLLRRNGWLWRARQGLTAL